MKSARVVWNFFFAFVLANKANSSPQNASFMNESNFDGSHDVKTEGLVLDYDIFEAQMMDLERREVEKEGELEEKWSSFGKESQSLDEFDNEWNAGETDTIETGTIRQLQTKTPFKPLLEAPCNARLLENTDACSTKFSTKFSDLIKGGEPTVVPCGICAYVDDSLEGKT